MATLVFSTIGRAIAGPVGALVGTVAGAFVDQQIFGAPSRQREGPRLSDLSVQSSAYGLILPRLYGRCRVAGNIIWSTGLREQRHEETTRVGGKGGGSVSSVTYSYSASFAVALSGRPVLGVERVWADGKLIRAAAGEPNVGGRMRIYTGDERQRPDPLMLADLGVNACPAHRGLAYVVFEDLPLEEFANRIPNLTFEVVADGGEDVAVATICADILTTCGIDAGQTDGISARLTGFSAGRQSDGQAVLNTLAQVAPLRFLETGTGLAVTDSLPATVRVLSAARLVDRRSAGGQAGNLPGASWQVERQDSGALPARISLAFSDPDRDYQVNVQRATRMDADPAQGIALAPAVVMHAQAAKQAAEQLLAQRWRARETLSLAVPWQDLALLPGDILQLPDAAAGDWQIDRVRIEAGFLEVQASPVRAADRLSLAATDSSNAPVQSVQPHGDSVLVVLDGAAAWTPPVDDYRLYLAAAGASAGWRRAAVYASLDDGASYQLAAQFQARSVMGSLRSHALQPDARTVVDGRSSVTVDLLAADMALDSVAMASLLSGANLCLLGNELLQFQQAEQLPDGGWRLSQLLRGRIGTEWAMDSHVAGEQFLLLDPGAIAPVLPAGLALGRSLLFKCLSPNQSLGDVSADALTFAARARKPLAPVHACARRLPGGDIRISWIRRSRSGYDWIDGSDAPLGEEAESYRLRILDGADPLRQFDVSVPEALYPAASISADFGAMPATLTVDIVQLSTAVGAGWPLVQQLAVELS